MQKKLTYKQILNLLGRINFMDRKFLLMKKGDGFLLQMSYMEPCIDNPGLGPVEQKTRKWYISPYMTVSEVVETAWACVCRSQIHVASEHFTFHGRRIYSQHFDVLERVDMCDQKKFDVRKPIR